MPVGSVYVLGHTFNIQLYNLQIYFSACMWPFDSQENAGNFKDFILQSISLFSLPSQDFLCVYCLPQFLYLPSWQKLIKFTLNVFDKCPLSSHLVASEEFWVRRNMEKFFFAPVLPGATRHFKTNYHNSWRTRSCSLWNQKSILEM